MKRFVLLIMMTLVLGATAFSADLNSLIDQAGLRPLKPGTQSIDFKLTNLNGKTVALSSLKGHVVLLNFWATWCPPCRGEIGSIESLYKKFKDKGFVVLAVDLQQDPSTVQTFAKQHGMTFTILLDRTGQVGYTYGARGIPTTYLIDKNGDVTSGVVGGHEWDTPQMAALLTALLQEN